MPKMPKWMAEKYPPASIDRAQFDALHLYAIAHGQRWKAKLQQAWEQADRDLDPVLYRMRGTHGPGWLYYFRLTLEDRP